MIYRQSTSSSAYLVFFSIAEEGADGSTLNVIAGGRHLTPLECPVQIAGEIEKLLEASA